MFHDYFIIIIYWTYDEIKRIFWYQLSVKNWFLIRNIILQFVLGLDCNKIFLIQKEAFNGLIKVIGKQIILL